MAVLLCGYAKTQTRKYRKFICVVGKRHGEGNSACPLAERILSEVS